MIADYEKSVEKWTRTSKNIRKKYRAEDGSVGSRDKARFSMLWSNVQTLSTATFARVPKPDVTRRHDDQDPVGRVASLILERVLEYEVSDMPDYAASLRLAIDDRFLGGRGTVWVRYEPTFSDTAVSVTSDAPEEGDEEEAGGPESELDTEHCPVDYVDWEDFGHSKARTWAEVDVVWRKVYMSRRALKDRFGENADDIPVDTPAPGAESPLQGRAPEDRRAVIYEVWDKSTSEAVWISGRPEAIEADRRHDPLGLDGFFPCPRPLYGTITSNSLVPVPDYIQYQDQAIELDMLSDRIRGLINALQVKGVYDASQPELARLFTEGSSGDLLPVKNWIRFAEQGGLSGAISTLDLRMIVEGLTTSYAAFEHVKEQIYEITGISDLRRGQTAASETATAQSLKAQYAGLREKRYQDEIAAFASDIIRLKAQIICGHYSPRTILEVAAVQQLTPQDRQLVPKALELLIGPRLMFPSIGPKNPLRDFRIEIATDSMIYQDEQQEKTDRVQLLEAISRYLSTVGPMIQQVPQAAPLLLELMKFATSSFRGARQVEGLIDGALQELQQSLSQRGQQPAPPDPRMIEQIRQQANAEVQQQHAAKAAQLTQRESQLASREQQLAAAVKVAGLEAQVQKSAMTAEAQISAEKLRSLKADVGRLITELDQKISESQSTQPTTEE
jgi:hypothetical protein